jgi:hydroxymethylpyrimidine pyrophosphatase-like HAD family hydrolase
MKKLIVFDLDGILVRSKSPLDTEMSFLLHKLLNIIKVAVISGGDWPQFEKQVLYQLPHEAGLENLFMLPTCGTKLYKYTAGQWEKSYSEDFTDRERNKITDSLTKAIQETVLKEGKI